MAVYTHVSAEALGEFLARYDVGELVSAKGIAEGVENSNYLVDTTKGRYFLTLYEKRVDAGDLPYFIALLDHLAKRGQPVPPAIKDRDGVEIQELQGRPACLIKFLPGVSLSHPKPVQAQAAGRAMGQMHAALADFPRSRPNSMGCEMWRPLLEKCGKALNELSPGLYDEISFVIDDISPSWESGLEVGTIHADLFPDNVLMKNDGVSGLIDFYFACTDIRIYDLAIMHTAWSFDASGERHFPDVGNALIKGYEETYPLNGNDHSLFSDLCIGACIRFTLSRAWDWLNAPAGALVTPKDPLAYWRRYPTYDQNLQEFFWSRQK